MTALAWREIALSASMNHGSILVWFWPRGTRRTTDSFNYHRKTGLCLCLPTQMKQSAA
uniref:Uncharacterized protein n=1 Tax=Arundo donax TaxID=35708 RepID=A0A0A9BZK8_ARUDO